MSHPTVVGKQPTNADILSAVKQNQREIAKTNQELVKTNQKLDQHINQSDQAHTDIILAVQGFANDTEQRFQEHDAHFSRIDEHLLEIDTDIKDIKETMATKQDIREIKVILEKVATTVEVTREEQIATTAWIKRIDAKVERHDRILSGKVVPAF